jgi:hypothetical protein
MMDARMIALALNGVCLLPAPEPTHLPCILPRGHAGPCKHFEYHKLYPALPCSVCGFTYERGPGAYCPGCRTVAVKQPE